MSVSLPLYFGWPTAAAALLIVIDHFLLNIITLNQIIAMMMKMVI